MPSSLRALVVIFGLAGLACTEPTGGPTHESAPLPDRDAEVHAEADADLPGPAAEPTTPYDRKAWKHWIDDDHDCQDTRTEVLIAEALEGVVFEAPRNCEVESGRWQCPYTGEIIREVHLLDVDHLVPLANAHRSGADTWDAARRQAYANDLDDPYHLIAVEYGANRSKGDNGPEAWLPPSEEFRCTYVREWVAVKRRWQLGMNEAEAAAVAADLAACDAGQIPGLPDKPARTREPEAKREAQAKREPQAEREAEAEREAGACCRVCKKGKACGDSCIGQDSTCTKPPGCACDADD